MKNLIYFVTIIIGLNSFSQSVKYVGLYENKTESEDGIKVEYKLSLNSDGTFLFHFYQDQIFYEDNDKAKGKWSVKNNSILFLVNRKVDIDENHKLDFGKTKAKIENKNLKLYDSGIFWINDVELKKI